MFRYFDQDQACSMLWHVINAVACNKLFFYLRSGVNFINCLTPYAEFLCLALNFCTSKKLLKSWAQGAKVGHKGAKQLMKLTPVRVWKSQLLLALFLIKTMLLFYWTIPGLATWYLLIQQMFVIKHKKQLRQCWLNKQWLHCRKLQFLMVTYFRPLCFRRTLFTALKIYWICLHCFFFFFLQHFIWKNILGDLLGLNLLLFFVNYFCLQNKLFILMAIFWS